MSKDDTFSAALMFFLIIMTIAFVIDFISYDKYKLKVETCRANYGETIEEITKCFDVQLEAG